MTELRLTCDDLDETLEILVERLRFRLLEIRPADDPRTAVIESGGVRIRLEREGGSEGSSGDWVTGRAGMRYRDLVPGRLGGRLVASHIQIPDGGPVPDYVHYHDVRFQMIYCYRGWVRVVYQDQGEPFVLRAGDCVLQPPLIRHRVLDCSPGLDVIEVGAPAEHSTHVDPELELPTPIIDPERDFGGQRFTRHVAADAIWEPWHLNGWEARDLGIGAATGGLAEVRVARAGKTPSPGRLSAAGRLLFVCVLEGSMRGGTLGPGDAIAAGPGESLDLAGASRDLQLLEVDLAAD